MINSSRVAEPTLVDCLVCAGRHPEEGLRILDRSGGATWLAWPEVVARAREVAGRLAGAGIQRGDRVALVYPTSVEFLDAFFGTVLAGAVPVPIYPPFNLGRLDEYRQRTASMLSAAGIQLVLADRRVRLVLGEVVAAAGPSLGCRSMTDLHDPAPFSLPEVEPGDIALVQFSSGTTRDPRPVALSHRSLVAQASLLNSHWPNSNGVHHSGVSWLPLYHDMGLIGSLLVALERPGTLTLIPPEMFVARPAVWLQAISAFRATISPGPNFAYSFAASRVRDAELEGVDLSCWKVALVGAEVVVPSVLREFSRRFQPWGFRPEALTPGYGLAEATLAVTLSEPSKMFVSRFFDERALAERGKAVEVGPDAEGAREITSCGRPLDGFEVGVAGENGERLAEGSVGAIECRGPSIMEGYLGLPEATAACLDDGWLKTGDLGFLLDGELFVTGRSKDVIIIRGRNYSPEEIERALDAVEGVRTGCSIAVGWMRDGASGEELLVFAEARRGTRPATFALVAKACEGAVVAAAGIRPESVIVLPAGTLPRTSSGKLRRQEALRRHLAGELVPPGPSGPLALARIMVRSAFADMRLRWRRQRS